MFTGIVEEMGRLKAREGSAQGATLVIAARKVLEDLKIGDSIAVNGVCLTVTSFDRSSFTAQVMPETLRKTNLELLAPGQPVNLERALALGDRLGGHLVSGHVDGTGTLSWRRPEGNAVIIFIQTPAELLRYIIPKGSVAVDGVSLTVAFVDGKGFSVSLIPHTAALTTLGQKQPGEMVNIETDLIGKYVEKLLQPYRSGEGPVGEKITMAMLRENGFLDS
ncbi:MAG TPA: riboflavin synthase [Bacillota bacterium]|nr:riboflavin synthase [Bacillota bacterium]